MRRGLISRSLAELPDAALDARLERLRAAMAEARLDALLVYTNNTRAAGVSWLTGFVPYWSEALLVVPRTREPVLVVALTYRVKSWIERTSRVADVIHTPRIGLEAARMIASAQADAAVGIADLDGLAAGIVDDLREGGPRLTLSDASALFARLRAEADPTEIALATKAASIAQTALAQAHGAGLGDIIAAVEARARTLGAEEVYIAAAPDLARERRFKRIEGEASLGESFALRATVAYKGAWVRLVRMCGSAAPAGDEADARFAAAVASSTPRARLCRIFILAGRGLPDRAAAGAADGIARQRIRIRPAPRALVSVQACLEIDGRPVLLGAPALLGGRGEAASLLIQPLCSPYGAEARLDALRRNAGRWCHAAPPPRISLTLHPGYGVQALFGALGAAGAAASPRACSAIAISDVPPNSMLMPTSSPSAHAAVPGSPVQIKAARMRSMMPLTSIQTQRLERSFLCSNAYMIEATPSMMKNTISSSVSETTPLTGQSSRTMPAAVASTADTSAHQNPGAWRAQKVVTRPTTPLTRNSQPRMMVTAMLAAIGIRIARMPSTTRTMPSIRNSFQCSRTACASALLHMLNVARIDRHVRSPSPLCEIRRKIPT